jgi:hypothetical protein
MSLLPGLQEELQRVSEDIINVESQLEHGDLMKKRGKAWLINARTALKHKKLKRDDLVRRIAEEKKRLRVDHSQRFGSQFINCARQLLPADKFAEIMAAVQVMQPIASPETEER